MINSPMLQANGSLPQGSSLASPPGFERINLANALTFQDDASCIEKIFNSFLCRICKPRYKVNDVQNSRIGDQTQYTIQMTKCMFPTQYAVYEGETDREIATFTQTGCCSLCGGPGFDINAASTSEKTGETWVPCQLLNAGVDVKDESSQVKYYIGSNWGCCTSTCNILCCGGCCKGECCCSKLFGCCSDSIYPAPIWDSERRLRLGTTNYVIPCITKCIPCMGRPYFLMTFPPGATSKDKMGIVSAHLLFGNQFGYFIRSGKMEDT